MGLRGHAEAIEEELRRHYRVVMDTFGKRILEASKRLPDRYETKDAEGEFAMRVNQWIERFAPSQAVGISQTTKSQIEDALIEGTALGFDLDEIATMVVRRTGGFRAGTIPFTRALVIARTETHSASVAAQDEMLTSIGLDDIQREWITNTDGRERDSHRAANGQRRKQDEMFDVGGAKLRFPGDPSGPASEIINCRCVLVGVIPEETNDRIDAITET